MQLHGNEAIIAAAGCSSASRRAGEAKFLARQRRSVLRMADRRRRPGDAIAGAAPHCPVERHDGAIMLPGLVNSHHHVGLTPLQMGTLDYPLELWIGSGAARRKLARTSTRCSRRSRC